MTSLDFSAPQDRLAGTGPFPGRTSLNDGHSIPRLGFGLWQVPPEQATDVVQHAITTGYRLIDTAEAYYNEEGVGEAIAASGVPREQFFVTTKVWNTHHGYERTLAAFDASLHRLGLDHVDMYLMHWPSVMRNQYVQTWQAMIRLKEEGRVRSIGVSNFAMPHLRRIIGETGMAPAVNQVELHPYFQQRELCAFHDLHGIVTESWSPLGIWKNPRPPIGDPTILAIADRHGITAAQVILLWHLQQDLVVIPKSVRPERMRENFQLAHHALTAQDMSRIATLDRVDGRLGPDPETATF